MGQVYDDFLVRPKPLRESLASLAFGGGAADTQDETLDEATRD
jgi:hypothetical protein